MISGRQLGYGAAGAAGAVLAGRAIIAWPPIAAALARLRAVLRAATGEETIWDIQSRLDALEGALYDD